MNYIILAIAVCICTLQSSIWNLFSKSNLKNITDCYAFNLMSGIISTLTLFLISGKVSIPSYFTIWLAVLFGIISALAQLFYTKALSTGPMSYSVLFSSCGMLIPTIAGILIFKESITFPQIIGILLLLISFYFGVNPKNDISIRAIWIFFGLMTFFGSGMIGVLQKTHQSSIYVNEINEFLIIAFITASITSAILFLWNKNVKHINVSFSFKSKVPMLALFAGICTGIINKTNLYLSGQLPSAIFFPVINGGVIIFSTFVAIFLFKEKITKIQKFSLFIGIIAIGLISKIMQNFI